MNYLLGIDLGSSSVKVSLVEVDSGRCAASASYPETEAPIKALQPGWAEQRPEDWWNYFKKALSTLNSKLSTLNSIIAIGITYQMHGLVCLDKNRQPHGEIVARQHDFVNLVEQLRLVLFHPSQFRCGEVAW